LHDWYTDPLGHSELWRGKRAPEPAPMGGQAADVPATPETTHASAGPEDQPGMAAPEPGYRLPSEAA
jgi:hypothetical protein